MDSASLMSKLKHVSVLLRDDMSIAQLEELEAKFKSLVCQMIESSPNDSRLAIEIARVQKEMGLLRKYKSYGVKCCTPLGYSIFLLNKGKGFSFQNHLEFKVEIFHVLSVLPGGYVFTCTEDEWNHVFDEKQFAEWFKGNEFPYYDVFKTHPTSGDVIKIDRTGIVYTAIGCILEEYANVSTDMVQRLFDQNKGKAIPDAFTKSFVENALNGLVFPEILDDSEHELHHSKEFVASRVSIGSSQSRSIECGNDFVSVYVTNGEGELMVGDESSDVIHLKKGDPVLLVPHSSWKLINTTVKSLQYSCLRVPKQQALK